MSLSNRRLSSCLLLVVLLMLSWVQAGYKIKTVEVRPAAEYRSRQEFQHLTIAALPCLSQEAIGAIFDTDKLLEKGIFPVLVVIDNQNDFAIRLLGSDVYLVDPEGNQWPSLSFVDVLLAVTLKKPLSSYATRKDILVRQAVDRNMYMDFEHKVFGEKLIAPHGSDYGIVFFSTPESGDLKGWRLYFPEISNVTSGESLVFFEFELIE